VIDGAAVVAERLFQGASSLHLLATSREAMRVEGEHVIHLSSLESPPDRPELSTEEILGFPAVQLFIERVVASGREFEFNEADAPVVAEICRKLDGIPLAIELAAGRINAFGIRGTAGLLNHPLDSLDQGRRTAVARHQTLAAMLDWSYEHLRESERLVFRRLSVFGGEFTLEAAHTVLAEEAAWSTELALASLIAKSLVVADTGRPITRYRMFDTTRAYGRRKLAVSGEADAIALSYAEFLTKFRQQLDPDFASPSMRETPRWRAAKGFRRMTNAGSQAGGLRMGGGVDGRRTDPRPAGRRPMCRLGVPGPS
jgi:predicted ATPase